MARAELLQDNQWEKSFINDSIFPGDVSYTDALDVFCCSGVYMILSGVFN